MTVTKEEHLKLLIEFKESLEKHEKDVEKLTDLYENQIENYKQIIRSLERQLYLFNVATRFPFGIY